MAYKTRQLDDFDCGVATVMTLFKKFGIEVDEGDVIKELEDYCELGDELNTSERIGTTPKNMIKVIGKHLKVGRGFGKVGYILVNEEFHGDYDCRQNGHWCYYEEVDFENVDVFDGYENETRRMRKDDLSMMTDHVRIGRKIFDGVIRRVGRKVKN
jgi:hypothetical protein